MVLSDSCRFVVKKKTQQLGAEEALKYLNSSTVSRRDGAMDGWMDGNGTRMSRLLLDSGRVGFWTAVSFWAEDGRKERGEFEPRGVVGAGEREDPDVCCGQLALGGSSPEALGWNFGLCGGAFATVAAELRGGADKNNMDTRLAYQPCTIVFFLSNPHATLTRTPPHSPAHVQVDWPPVVDHRSLQTAQCNQ